MTDTPQAAAPAAPPGPIAGLGVTLIVVVLIAAWIVLGLQFMAETSLVGGFLMLWYWASNLGLDIKRLPAALVGAVVGIGIAWFLVYGATHYGGAGVIASGALLLLALYLDIIKAVPLIVNTTTMLYITLAAAPLVQLHVNWGELVISTVAGGVFFAVAVESLKWLAAKFAAAG